MSVRLRLLLALLATLPLGAAHAAGDTAALRARLARLIPPGEIQRLEPTPVAGLYEVVFDGRVYYFTEDGAYLLRGDLVEVASRRNLTEDTRRSLRLAALDRLGEDSMIVFSPPHPRHTVTVFTDVDCPYCARFHRGVAKLNAMGIKVRYAAFPREGIPSSGYERMVSVWCAPDPRQALTDAKAQRPVAPAVCRNPVKAQYEVGQALGIGGTPTIILDNGELIGGYVSPARLLRMLDDG